MIGATIDLYAARVAYARATPGSREWWKAIRQMRSAIHRQHQAIIRMAEAISEFTAALHQSVEPLIRAFKSLSGVCDR